MTLTACSGPSNPATSCEEGAVCGECGVVRCAETGAYCTATDVCTYFETVLEMPRATPPRVTTWGSGVAFGDVNGDGHVDLVVGGDRIDVLRGDGAGAFVPYRAFMEDAAAITSSVVLVDDDGDGDLDLFLTTQHPEPGAQLWRNQGDGRFRESSHRLPRLEGDELGGASWGDYDLDGDLDVFIPAYGEERSYLLRNDGSDYVDVAEELGLSDPTAASLQGVFVDLDVDGDVDLLVANDKGPSTRRGTHLYRNDSGTLTLVDSGMTHFINGMGIAVGDVDGDSDLDVFVSDIGYHDDGQKLYLNQGDLVFEEVAREWNIAEDQRYGWGSELLDLDNDGDLDLLMADTASDTALVAENRGSWFVPIDRVIDAPTFPQVGLASADFDGDGAIDLAWWFDRAETARARIVRNVYPRSGAHFSVELAMSGPNTRAIGATVFIEADGVTQMRPIIAGGSFFSSSEPVAYFGVGSTTEIDRVEVVWPGGDRTEHGPFRANQRILLER